MKFGRKFKSDQIKGLFFAFLIALSIWIFSILNAEYKFNLKVPLKIIHSEKFSLIGKIPNDLDVQILATGWQIINLSFFPRTSSCIVKVEEFERIGDKVVITKQDLIRGLNLAVNAEPLDVVPGLLTLEIGTIVAKIVKVVPDVVIKPRENFIVEEPIVQPDMIVIYGQKELVDKIETWKTQQVILEDVFKPVDLVVPLSDTLRSQINLSQENVRILANVELFAEQVIEDVPILIEGGHLPEGHYIEPKYVRVTIRSGVTDFMQSEKYQISAKIDINDIIKDTIGILIPKIEARPSTTVVSFDPPYVYHWRRFLGKQITQR
ncbi:MAG: CdaR family protein [Ignavibacteria bacterium]|nr:CdaR family protein [Ignavibacteria bacterium]